jgi:O-antigen ligase
MAALIAAIIVAARSRTGVVSTAPLSGPLEYINADGAFYVQAAIAGLMVASMGRSTLVRAVGFLGAGFFAALPFIVHAAAAAWLVLVLPSVALASVLLTGGRGPRASVALFALFFVASLTASILLGSTYSKTAHKSVFQRAAMKAVDEDRLLLWRDAFVIMRDHPETGVGPRRYQVVSPIGSKDPDYRWAHNEFLQQGAETGIAGLAILAAFFLWGFARLWAVRAPGAVTALGAASLAALGIHSCVDYVMHFPAIPLITAGLVGAAMIDGNERDLPKSAGAT